MMNLWITGVQIGISWIWILVFAKIEKLNHKKNVVFGVGFSLLINLILWYRGFDLVEVGFWIMLVSILVLSALMDMQNQTLPIEYYLAAVPLMGIRIVLGFAQGLAIELIYDLGLILLLAAFGGLFRRVIGWGDILLLITITGLIGYQQSLPILLFALLLTAIVGLVGVVFKHWTRAKRLPLAPFLLISTMLYSIVK